MLIQGQLWLAGTSHFEGYLSLPFFFFFLVWVGSENFRTAATGGREAWMEPEWSLGTSHWPVLTMAFRPDSSTLGRVGFPCGGVWSTRAVALIPWFFVAAIWKASWRSLPTFPRKIRSRSCMTCWGHTCFGGSRPTCSRTCRPRRS